MKKQKEKIKKLVVNESAMKDKKLSLQKTAYPCIILASLIQIFAFGVFPKIYYSPDNREFNDSNLFSSNEVIISEEEQSDILKEIESVLGISIQENEENYLLLNAVVKNPYLTQKEKEVFYRFIEYFNDNPYIDREKIYENILNVNARFALRQSLHVDESVLAMYLPNYRDIVYFTLFPTLDTMAHEDAHALEAEGNTEVLPRWLSEGMSQLIASEYFSETPFLLTGIYPYEVSMVKLMMEIIGTDKVLQAYTEKKPEIIYEALDESIGKKDTAKQVLETIDWWLEVYSYRKQLTKSENEKVAIAFEKFLDYINEKEYAENQSYQYHLGVVLCTFTSSFGTLDEWQKFTYCKAYLSSSLKEAGYQDGFIVKTEDYLGSVYQK